MDHPCGPGPWTIPVDHPSFCKVRSLRERAKWSPHLSGQFQHFSQSYRHLKISGGAHDPYDVRTVVRTGQFVGLVCSGEGLDELNECIFEVPVIDESLWSHQFEMDGI